MGSPPVLRIDGRLENVEGTFIGPGEAEQMALDLLGPERESEFRAAGEYDFSYPLEGGVRFRVNVYRQRGGSV